MVTLVNFVSRERLLIATLSFNLLNHLLNFFEVQSPVLSFVGDTKKGEMWSLCPQSICIIGYQGTGDVFLCNYKWMTSFSMWGPRIKPHDFMPPCFIVKEFKPWYRESCFSSCFLHNNV